jgi:hypothetical protein
MPFIMGSHLGHPIFRSLFLDGQQPWPIEGLESFLLNVYSILNGVKLELLKYTQIALSS